jgi:zinc and cadmium transporter
MMLGVGMLHMLGHSLTEAQRIKTPPESANAAVLLWMLAGCVTMFFIERFFCFHHHDVETDSAGHVHEHEEACEHRHGHDITWSGAALGLALHSLLEGVALAASVEHQHGASKLAGLGTFLVIFLHKPFDSMTIALLMARGGWSARARLLANGLFALVIPVGAALVFAGLTSHGSPASTTVNALAFSAGTFLCIALSDLLPELQFHDHDRVALSLALLAGLALSIAVGRLESLVHRHDGPGSSSVSPDDDGVNAARPRGSPFQSSR